MNGGQPVDGGRRCIACREQVDAPGFTAVERLLGTRESFTYWECPACGCVQIESVPEDLGRHYPDHYFAYKPQHRLAGNRWRGWLDPLRFASARGNGGVLGALANRLLKPLDYARWSRVTGLDSSARVLDVGCGNGKLLVRMRHAGFRECVGVDPFLREPLHYANGVVVHRQSLFNFATDHPQQFDLVMFHHSLEHTPIPHETLEAATRVMAPGAWMLVRVPVAGTFAWRTYRENWFALDPPRHLFLPTTRSMDAFAAAAGLAVEHVRFDSTLAQFALSELYVRDICPDTPHRERKEFSRRQLDDWRRRAEELNTAGDGDQAEFYLRAP